jgi:hypothetical protein
VNDARPALNGPRQVFSDRLREFLDQVIAGETPNFGAFCCFCYNPLPPGYERCDHCGQSLSERPALESVPQEVLLMHRRKLKRESVVVNSFAYFGLALGLGIFLGMVAINEIGFRYANKHLAEDWAEHVTQRETQRGV